MAVYWRFDITGWSSYKTCHEESLFFSWLHSSEGNILQLLSIKIPARQTWRILHQDNLLKTENLLKVSKEDGKFLSARHFLFNQVGPLYKNLWSFHLQKYFPYLVNSILWENSCPTNFLLWCIPPINWNSTILAGFFLRVINKWVAYRCSYIKQWVDLNF